MWDAPVEACRTKPKSAFKIIPVEVYSAIKRPVLDLHRARHLLRQLRQLLLAEVVPSCCDVDVDVVVVVVVATAAVTAAVVC